MDVDGLGNPRGSESDLVGIGNTTQNQWHLTRNEYSALSVGAILQNSPGHALAGNTGVPGMAGGMGSSNLAAAAAAQQAAQFGGGGAPKALPFNQQQLSRAWDVSQVPSHRHILLPPISSSRPTPSPFPPAQRSTAADWNEWLRRFNVDLLKESPSPALRSCGALAQAYTPLARDLFHAAFVSCWHELSEQYQDSLVRALQVRAPAPNPLPIVSLCPIS